MSLFLFCRLNCHLVEFFIFAINIVVLLNLLIYFCCYNFTNLDFVYFPFLLKNFFLPQIFSVYFFDQISDLISSSFQGNIILLLTSGSH